MKVDEKKYKTAINIINQDNDNDDNNNNGRTYDTTQIHWGLQS